MAQRRIPEALTEAREQSGVLLDEARTSYSPSRLSRVSKEALILDLNDLENIALAARMLVEGHPVAVSPAPGIWGVFGCATGPTWEGYSVRGRKLKPGEMKLRDYKEKPAAGTVSLKKMFELIDWNRFPISEERAQELVAAMYETRNSVCAPVYRGTMTEETLPYTLPDREGKPTQLFVGCGSLSDIVPLIRAIEEADETLLSTSANQPGERGARRQEEVEKHFPEMDVFLFDFTASSTDRASGNFPIYNLTESPARLLRGFPNPDVYFLLQSAGYKDLDLSPARARESE